MRYRTVYACYPRHDERWKAGSEHELAEAVAIGLCLIHAGLLELADGTPMPALPERGTPEYAAAIAAAHRAIVHAERPTTTTDHAAINDHQQGWERVGPEIQQRR
jgi:hypothetical protein